MLRGAVANICYSCTFHIGHNASLFKFMFIHPVQQNTNLMMEAPMCLFVNLNVKLNVLSIELILKS